MRATHRRLDRNGKCCQCCGGTQINEGSTVTPTAATGVSAAADPLASLPEPTYSDCDQNSFTVSGGSTYNLNGTIYVPSAQAVFSGGSTSGRLTLAVVRKTFTVSGASYLAKDTTSRKAGMVRFRRIS